MAGGCVAPCYGPVCRRAWLGKGNARVGQKKAELALGQVQQGGMMDTEGKPSAASTMNRI
jgi:hypothetical protein